MGAGRHACQSCRGLLAGSGSADCPPRTAGAVQTCTYRPTPAPYSRIFLGFGVGMANQGECWMSAGSNWRPACSLCCSRSGMRLCVGHALHAPAAWLLTSRLHLFPPCNSGAAVPLGGAPLRRIARLQCGCVALVAIGLERSAGTSLQVPSPTSQAMNCMPCHPSCLAQMAPFKYRGGLNMM